MQAGTAGAAVLLRRLAALADADEAPNPRRLFAEPDVRQLVASILAEVDGQPYLVAPVTADTIDALAAFEAEGEDRENDLCDEPQTWDYEPSIGGHPSLIDAELDDCDLEYDYRHGPMPDPAG